MKLKNKTDLIGFWFRADNNLSKRYYFIISADAYSIGYYDNHLEKWIDLKDWTYSSLIKSNSSNIMELALIDDYITAFINGKYLTTIHGIKNLTGNYCGFVVGTGHMRYGIDDFCMVSLKKM